MIINDLEFINFHNQPNPANFDSVHGGASASAWVNTSATDNNVVAAASASASGDISAAATGTSTAIINVGVSGSNIGYAAGYATGYGAAYAVERYGSFASDTSTSTSIVQGLNYYFINL